VFTGADISAIFIHLAGIPLTRCAEHPPTKRGSGNFDRLSPPDFRARMIVSAIASPAAPMDF
jgi:hypothetical protein